MCARKRFRSAYASAHSDMNLLSVFWIAKDDKFFDADNRDSNQSARMIRRIWVFNGRTCQNITKTYLYNFDPLKPHFYIVKLGFTGVYIIFLISAQNIDCGYSLEPPRWGGSNEYPQTMFWAENKKNIRIFIWKFSFFGGKIFSIFE